MEKNDKLNKKNSDDKVFPKVGINWYPGHMAKAKRLMKEKLPVIDVVYEVADARIPFSSKIKDLDEIIGDKPRILILTKMDLCDKNETNKWIKYYENMNYKVIGVDLETGNDTKKIIKATEEMMMSLREKEESKGMKHRRLKVLIVGIPNAGKSTLINRLVGKKAVNVGNKPGITKSLDWIRINDSLELLDTPGILWPKLDIEEVAFNLASLTAIKEEVLPIYEVVCYILKMLHIYYPEILKERYGVEEIDYDDMVLTLDYIGKRRGCIIHGGDIDYDRVMNLILNDVKNGHIKGITFDRVVNNNEKC